VALRIYLPFVPSCHYAIRLVSSALRLDVGTGLDRFWFGFRLPDVSFRVTCSCHFTISFVGLVNVLGAGLRLVSSLVWLDIWFCSGLILAWWAGILPLSATGVMG
jgi:hypothetical protein